MYCEPGVEGGGGGAARGIAFIIIVITATRQTHSCEGSREVRARPSGNGRLQTR